MNIDVLITETAAGQHGAVSRVQLRTAGIPAHRIEHRVRTGRLDPVYRGVYRVGPIPGERFREMAAVLACGGGAGSRAAVISHRTAGAMAAQLVGPSHVVELIVPGWRGRKRAGLLVHRLPDLPDDEVTVMDGVPVTTPVRTLLDLASVLPLRDLEHAVARTLRVDLATTAEIRALVERHAPRQGTRILRSLLDAEAEPALTRSEPEERLLLMIRKAALPPPRANALVQGFEVDLLWPDHRLVVEVDGFAYHSSPRAFERDHARDAALAGAGLRVLRFTWRQIVQQPEATIGLIALTLGQQLASTADGRAAVEARRTVPAR